MQLHLKVQVPHSHASSIAAAMRKGHARVKLDHTSLAATLLQAQKGELGNECGHVDFDCRTASDAAQLGALMRNLLSGLVLQSSNNYTSQSWCGHSCSIVNGLENCAVHHSGHAHRHILFEGHDRSSEWAKHVILSCQATAHAVCQCVLAAHQAALDVCVTQAGQ